MNDKAVHSFANYPDLAGRAGIVTGVGGIIGGCVAGVLAQQGMKLLITDRGQPEVDRSAEALKQGGWTCEKVVADLSIAEGTRKVFAAAVQSLGRIDVLVNCAARRWSRAMLGGDEADYRSAFEENVRITYLLSQLVAGHMAKEGIRGAIVNLSSVGGLRAHPASPAYDAGKGAIDSLTRSMAIELAGRGIRVNAVAPGWTPGKADLAKKPQLAGKSSLIPLRRPGTPQDTAAAVAFLASDASSYITGQVLYVDGGLSVQLMPPGLSV